MIGGRKTTLVIGLVLAAFLLIYARPAVTEEAKPDAEFTAWWTIKDLQLLNGGALNDSASRVSIMIKKNLVRYHDLYTMRMLVLNFDTQTFWVSNYKSKTIGEGSFDVLRKLYAEKNKRLDDDIEKLEDSLDGLKGMELENRRAVVEALKLNSKIDEEDIVAKPNKAMVKYLQGYEVEAQEIFVKNKKVGEVWVSNYIEIPKRWNEFLKLMAELEPERWRFIAPVKNIPFETNVKIGNFDLNWTFSMFNQQNVAISNFLLPKDFTIVNPTID